VVLKYLSWFKITRGKVYSSLKRNHFLTALVAFLAAGLAAFFWGLATFLATFLGAAAFLATFLGAAFLVTLGLAWITFFAKVS
jgi:hypothetical protein